MKKLLPMLFVLGVTSVSNALEFNPSTAEIGESVTLSWGGLIGNYYGCTVNAGDKSYSGLSGNKTFTADESLTANMTCTGPDGSGGYHVYRDSADLTVITPKPQITINFPNVVPQNGQNTLKVSANYHNSCEVRVGISGFPKTFTGNDATYIVKFTSQGNRNIDVECTGPSGTSFSRKEVYVGPPVGYGGLPPFFGGDDPVIEN